MVGRTLEEISVRVNLDWYSNLNKDYEVTDTIERFMYHINELSKSEFATFDTETTGLNINSLPWGSKHKDTCVGISITYREDQGFYIPLQHMEFGNIPMKYVVKYLFPLMESLAWGGHNTIFDVKVLYDMGCKVNIVHDSMILLFNIYSKVAKGTKALKQATRLLYGHETPEFSDLFEGSSDYTKFRYVDKEVCKIYTCADSDYPYKIIKDNFNFLDERQKEAYMRDVSYVSMVAVSEYHGKPINSELLGVCVEGCKENIRTLENTLFDYVGWKLTGCMSEPYRFKTTSSGELIDVLYNKLKVDPVESKNKTGYKVDKFVLKKLSEDKSDTRDLFVEERLKDGILDNVDMTRGTEKLLDHKELVYAKCVPSHILMQIRKQYKNLTSFFNKIIAEFDGSNAVYYSGISLTNTETARLVDFIQTLDKNLKELIAVPKNKKQYMFNFDFAQIEYRVMAALANMVELCEKLSNSHTDFHVELVAIIMKILPELVSEEMRSKFKSINFGIPYGMREKGLVNNMKGVGLTETERKEAEKEVGEMLKLWEEALPEIMKMLNSYRRTATTPRPYEHKMTESVKNKSYIHTPDGRVRIFDLKDGSREVISKIERMSGNTPIQNFARTIFMQSIKDLYDELVSLGLTDKRVENKNSPTGYSFVSKVTINGYIHDEVIGFADNDVNPYFLYNLIHKYCMKDIIGHPTYYCGINICNNWGEGKDGKYEAPVDFVIDMQSDKMIVEPKDNWPEIIAEDMTEWVREDARKYVEGICGSKLTKDKVLDVDYLLIGWKDYYYKKKIKSFGVPSNLKLPDGVKEDESFKVVNKLVGILILSGYVDLEVVWKDKGILSFKGLQIIGGSEPECKEVELYKKASDNLDVYDDEDIDDAMQEEFDSLTDYEKEACIKDNIGILRTAVFS